MPRLLTLLAALAACLPATALAQVVSAGPERVSVVVYPGDDANQRNPYRGNYGEGLVMVTERRIVDLPAGPSKISFRGVADGIVAQTAAIEGLSQGVKEQNFDYNLLTPGSLIARSEGREARLVRTDPATGRVTEERARIISGRNGVVLDFQGRLEALRCSGMPEKLVLDALPPGFTDKPTLSVETVSPTAGRRVLTLSYLASGVSWAAEYVARIRPGGKTLDLMSWVTVANRSGTTFKDAPVQVLAGTLRRDPQTRAIQALGQPQLGGCWRIDSGRNSNRAYGAPPPPPPPPPPARPAPPMQERGFSLASGRTLVEVVPEDLGDNKLYSLPQPLTLAAYQTKQLAMFDRRGVAFRRLYRCDLFSPLTGQRETPVLAIAELPNKRAGPLGLALPKGKAIVFEPAADGRMLLIGEDNVRDTPVDQPLELSLGKGFGVSVEPTIVKRWSVGEGASRKTRVEVVVTVTNKKPIPVIAQIGDGLGVGGGGAARVLKESRPHTLKRGRAQWEVIAPANGTVALTYTLETDG